VIGTGVAPNAIQTVIGITKAYCTRVGGGLSCLLHAWEACRAETAEANKESYTEKSDARTS
jgi:adenylosuccinate synthase